MSELDEYYATGYPCSRCSGRGQHLGTLGIRDAWRCRQCGHTFNTLAMFDEFDEFEPELPNEIPPEYAEA